MNRKGQTGLEIGVIIGVFITVIVGIILFQAIAQEVGTSTTLAQLDNVSIGVIENGTDYYFTDYKALTNVIIRNYSGGYPAMDEANYTITNNVINPTTGALSVRLNASESEMATQTWYVNATGQRLTYISSPSSRAIAGLIAIFFALAIAVVALTPTLKSGVLNLIGK